MSRTESVAGELARLVEDVTGRPVRLDDPAATATPLWNLGLDSAEVIRLLNAVEDSFGVVWSLDDSVDALSSFDALAAHVAARATVPPGPAGGRAER